MTPQFLFNGGGMDTTSTQPIILPPNMTSTSQSFFIQMPPTTSSSDSTNEMTCQSSNPSTNNDSTKVVVGEKEKDNNVNDSNIHSFLMQQQQTPQQLICVQPDGTIMLQTVSQPIAQQPQPQQLQQPAQIVDYSQLVQPIMMNAEGKIAISPYGEGRKVIPAKKGRLISEKLREIQRPHAAAAKKPARSPTQIQQPIVNKISYFIFEFVNDLLIINLFSLCSLKCCRWFNSSR